MKQAIRIALAIIAAIPFYLLWTVIFLVFPVTLFAFLASPIIALYGWLTNNASAQADGKEGLGLCAEWFKYPAYTLRCFIQGIQPEPF